MLISKFYEEIGKQALCRSPEFHKMMLEFEKYSVLLAIEYFKMVRMILRVLHENQLQYVLGSKMKNCNLIE